MAVLLYTWNRSYYRFRPPDGDHIAKLEVLLEENRTQLAGARSRSLTSLTSDDGAWVDPLFAAFEGLLGPVGAAKALHLLAPAFFPIWDRRIAEAYRCGLGARGTNAPLYLRFMALTADQCRALANVEGTPPDLVKALDEWNYIRISRADALT